MTNAFIKEFISNQFIVLRKILHRIKNVYRKWMKRKFGNLQMKILIVGNLILHLCGNIRQYIISALGEIKI